MSQLRLGRVINFQRWTRDAIEEIRKIFDKKLWPADNFQQVTFRGTTPAIAGDEFTLTHNLKRGPSRQDASSNWLQGVEFIYWLDGTGTLYESDYANWTDNEIKLKCSEASRGYCVIVR